MLSNIAVQRNGALNLKWAPSINYFYFWFGSNVGCLCFILYFCLNEEKYNIQVPDNIVELSLFYFSLSIPIWPTKQQIVHSMPDCFKNTYPSTRVIIDCTELYVQVPSSLAIQSALFSSYKHRCAYKGLLGISPSGAVTFISQLYPWFISDKEIAARSGFLTLFDMGLFWTVSYGEGHEGPHHNFVVFTPMIIEFGTGIKLDVFYILVTKRFVTSLLLRHYDVITCIIANA